MSLHPQHLQLWMIVFHELEKAKNTLVTGTKGRFLVAKEYHLKPLENPVHLLEVALVEIDQSLGLQHALVPVQQLTGRQTPEKSERTKTQFV